MQRLYKNLLQKPSWLKKIKLVFVLPILCLSLAQKAGAQTINVNTLNDVVDGTTTSVANLNSSPGAGGLISLREACMAATNDAGSNITIVLTIAGTYILNLGAAGDDAGASGDLDLNHGPAAGSKTITINGIDTTQSIIQQNIANDRIIELAAISLNNAQTFTVNFNRIRFQNGTAASGFPQGGAILAGGANDITNITDCAFNNNSATNTGGAVTQTGSAQVHHMTILNSTFMGNSVTGTGDGGALYYNGQGNLVVTNCKFISNTANTGDGGAIGITGGGTGGLHTIQRNQFIANRVTGAGGRGGAVANLNGDINLNYNRFIGNTVVTAGNGNVLAQDNAIAGNVITATDNWWGVNTGAAAADVYTIAGATAPVTTPYLQLKTSASPTTICQSGTSSVTASFLSNSASTAIAAGNLTALAGLPVTWVVSAGSFSGGATIASGVATGTYTAPASGASATVNAQVDNVPAGDLTARVTITLSPAPSFSVNPSNSTTCLGLASTFTATASNFTSLVWQESTTAGFGSPTNLTNTGIYSGATTGTLTISDNTTVTGRYYRLSATGGCGTVNSTGAQLLATTPALPTAATTSTTQAVNTNNNLYYAAGCQILGRIIPGTLTGNVTSTVWVHPTVPSYLGGEYVQRIYQITPATNPGTATATVTLYYLQSEFNNFNAANGSSADLPINAGDNTGKMNLRIAKYPGSSSNNSGAPNTYPGPATIINPLESDIVFNSTLNRWEITIPVTGFSGFLVQTSAVPLPVNLLSFNAQLVNNDVRLNWRTGSETQNDHFEVERSADGRTYTSIGQVQGTNGNSVRSYDLTDAGVTSLPARKLFYRLKIVSVSGEIDYSNIVLVQLDARGGLITSVLPNPFRDKLSICINAPNNGRMDIAVVDMAGRTVIRQQSAIAKGFSTESVQGVDKLGSGIYSLRIEFNGIVSIHKLVKQ